jgi:hypothetical protein
MVEITPIEYELILIASIVLAQDKVSLMPLKQSRRVNLIAEIPHLTKWQLKMMIITRVKIPIKLKNFSEKLKSLIDYVDRIGKRPFQKWPIFILDIYNK